MYVVCISCLLLLSKLPWHKPPVNCYLTVSVGWESESSLAGWFWLKVCCEVVARAAIIWNWRPEWGWRICFWDGSPHGWPIGMGFWQKVKFSIVLFECPHNMRAAFVQRKRSQRGQGGSLHNFLCPSLGSHSPSWLQYSICYKVRHTHCRREWHKGVNTRRQGLGPLWRLATTHVHMCISVWVYVSVYACVHVCVCVCIYHPAEALSPAPACTFLSCVFYWSNPQCFFGCLALGPSNLFLSFLLSLSSSSLSFFKSCSLYTY